MLAIGDVHIYVTDLVTALRFWGDGMRLRVSEREITAHSGYACLDCADGGPSIRLIARVDPWPPGARPEPATRPGITFDVVTTEFEETLARLLEHGGETVGETEIYNGLQVVTVRDPDGNTFELLEVPADDADMPG